MACRSTPVPPSSGTSMSRPPTATSLCSKRTSSGTTRPTLQGRRAARPAREYRAATDTERAEFEEHFDKRKVVLGSCGRPYATPCEHEHACIRCPMLQVDPVMIDRLNEINEDLITRRVLTRKKRVYSYGHDDAGE